MRKRTAKPSLLRQRLIEAVSRGETLDLAGDEPVDKARMRSWGPDRTVQAEVLRDIIRGQLVTGPDPRGVRLRGVRIDGIIDLENISSELNVYLHDCFLPQGLLLRDARLRSLTLSSCRIGQTADSTVATIDAARFTARAMELTDSTVTANSSAGAIQLYGGHVGQLKCNGTKITNPSGPALMADGLQTDGAVFLRDGFAAAGAGELGAVRLVGARIGASLECDGAKLSNTSGAALAADNLWVGQAVYMRKKFTATGTGKRGAVWLLGARIGASLECDGARLSNASGPAMVADGLQTERGVFLRNGFTATGAGELGAVRLVGARIGASLDCEKAKLSNPSGPALNADNLQVGQAAYLGNGFTASGTGERAVIVMRGIRIGGRLALDADKVTQAGGGVGPLVDLDGLTYAGLLSPDKVEYWLHLLRERTPAYAAQPYQQLAAVHRGAGHDQAVRRILMAQRDDQIHRKAIPGWDRTWARLTRPTLGYGYQPWRALPGLVLVLILSIGWTWTAGQHGGLAHTSRAAKPGSVCITTELVGVGLDLGTPLLKTGARDTCAPTATAVGQRLVVAGWLLQIVAWASTALFVAGFTGAVRKT